MDKGILSKGKVHKKQKRKLSIAKQDTVTFIISLFGFFLGRVAVFQLINPVGIAFLSAFLGRGSSFYLITFFTMLGMLTRFTGVYFVKYCFSVAILIAVNIVIYNKSVKASSLVKGISAAVSLLIPNILITYALNRGMYFVIISILEGILAFSLVFVMKKGINIVEGKQKLIDNEALMSLAILLGTIVAGSADVYIGTISLKFFLSSFIVLVISSKGGSSMGATTGVLLGFILTMTGASNFTLVGILSIAGLISGLMKDIKVWGSILGFWLGGLVSAIYLDIFILDMALFYSVVLASVVYIFLPKNFNFNLQEIIAPQVNNYDDYVEKVKEVTSYKLECFSNSFKNLANTFSGISEKKVFLDQHDISKLIDEVANKVCYACANKRKCWENNFYNTYQMQFTMFGICEKKGSLLITDMSQSLTSTCISLEKLIDTTNRVFEIYKNNLLWHNKVVESRELVSQQLIGVSGIIQGLGNEINLKFNFKTSLEQSLLIELNKNKIDVNSVIVLENSEGKYEVTLSYKNYRDKRYHFKDIIPVVNKVLDRKMKKDESDWCNGMSKSDNYKTRLLEEEKYKVVSGVARLIKEESKESGDSYSFMDIKGEQCLLALSDGMGSGKKAREESTAAVELLEDFINTGFDKETALKMINSVLVLKSSEDSFSTLDMCFVDLYTGVSEFIKVGASSTFIVRDEQVHVVRSSSLPMGILNSIDIEVTTKRLKDGDMVVMVTDGITEICDVGADKEDWIIKALSNFKSSNPQDIADYILKEAKYLSNGVIKDDMTVMAARIWEKV